MRIDRADPRVAKGWNFGPWNANIGISVSFANKGVDEPHLHRQMTEIYLMARGTAEMRVEQETVTLVQDDVIVIEPGEAHTFRRSAPGHFHFVIQTPGLTGGAANADKMLVSRAQLDL